MAQQYAQRVGTDRFGRPQIVKGMKPAKSKGGTIDKIAVCYVELKGQLYKISVSDANSNDKGIIKWCSVTKIDKRTSQSM